MNQTIPVPLDFAGSLDLLAHLTGSDHGTSDPHVLQEPRFDRDQTVFVIFVAVFSVALVFLLRMVPGSRTPMILTAFLVLVPIWFLTSIMTAQIIVRVPMVCV